MNKNMQGDFQICISVPLIKNWEKVLESKGFGRAVLMDLSKEFDAINHNLFIAKLHEYGFSNDSL